MSMNPFDPWPHLRTAYRPEVPELDTAAIMGAVRREAAAQPWRRPAGLAAPVPVWLCATAAALALLATVAVVSQSIAIADRHISQAWMQSVQPDEFARNFLDFSSDSSL